MAGGTAMPDGVEEVIRTTDTSLEEVGRRLADWLATRLETNRPPRVHNLVRPTHSGMSSISVLFDVDWVEQDGTARTAELVARLTPEASAFPVFPAYDLKLQYEVMRAVGEHTSVPVPQVLWVENSPEPLGTPFLVMTRVDGVVAVDNPPYVFGGWLYDMDAAGRRRVQDAAVDVLARVHAVDDPAGKVAGWSGSEPGTSLRRHFENERAYYEWTRRDDGLRIPVLEKAFDWLEAHWPQDPSPDVLCWGDARIGNIMYDGDVPAAVLDWESAVLCPRELDLGWFLFFHRQFQDLAEQFSMPGLPDMFTPADVIRRYEEVAGVEACDLDFYLTYAALRHGIVMSRIERRRIRFGEVEAHENPDEYVMHHRMLTQLIDGTYQWEK
ncbi:phosphotransferase family protein [Rhodococcus sp. D2-41]|uniref:Phosphotransferase family protein n=1 Tax=Speluncibacter jeojiensis TaxID=2710754 RepID=A0A9X4RCX4_9ACTN|nr:phosphotransferase family protein [Rhodococcus sp. D2-41]MDG3012052.1 phosphotransferase family protein [Rhodococcus sp. D2-41]MDG3013507.1 phosphotransferase family protein [Corynebacteriales bacterium D3-21]